MVILLSLIEGPQSRKFNENQLFHQRYINLSTHMLVFYYF